MTKRIVKPLEIAQQFLERYEMHKRGEEYDTIFTNEQSAAMINTATKDPQEMVKFFYTVQAIIIETTALKHPDDYLEIARVLSQWNNTLSSYLVPVMSMLSKPLEEREAMAAEYDKQQALKNAEKYTTTKDDFKLDDIGDLIKQAPEQIKQLRPEDEEQSKPSDPD